MRATSAPVASVMHRSTVSVRHDTTIRQVAETLAREEVGAVVVRGAEGLAGIVSERDIVTALAEGVDPDAERAADVMTYDVVSVGSADSLETVARVMLDGGIRHLPVIDAGGPVGIVSIRDLLGLYLDGDV
ncbi:MAG: cyclic nucleotide-binding/CBS domain-containing protein [Acidimicrobiales bacterium]